MDYDNAHREYLLAVKAALAAQEVSPTREAHYQQMMRANGRSVLVFQSIVPRPFPKCHRHAKHLKYHLQAGKVPRIVLRKM